MKSISKNLKIVFKIVPDGYLGHTSETTENDSWPVVILFELDYAIFIIYGYEFINKHVFISVDSFLFEFSDLLLLLKHWNLLSFQSIRHFLPESFDSTT